MEWCISIYCLVYIRTDELQVIASVFQSRPSRKIIPWRLWIVPFVIQSIPEVIRLFRLLYFLITIMDLTKILRVIEGWTSTVFSPFTIVGMMALLWAPSFCFRRLWILSCSFSFSHLYLHLYLYLHTLYSELNDKRFFYSQLLCEESPVDVD